MTTFLKTQLDKNAVLEQLNNHPVAQGSKSWLAALLGYKCDLTITRKLSSGWNPSDVVLMCQEFGCEQEDLEEEEL